MFLELLKAKESPFMNDIRIPSGSSRRNSRKWKLIVSFCATQLLVSTALAVCEIPAGNEGSDYLNRNRLNCLAESHFLDPQPDLQSPEFQARLTQPKIKDGIPLQNGADIHCRFHYQSQNGNSAKFRCALTNAQNQLFDSKGQLVPQAAGLIDVGDDVYLADPSGNRIEDRKAYIMKIRYSNGEKRNRENYSSTTASRLLWALGVPAHTNIMSNQILCFGCEQDPFGRQRRPVVDRRGNYPLTAFRHASIEIKYDGKRMYDPTQNPWSWSEVNQNLSRNIWTPEKRTEIEAFALANQFLGFTSDGAAQNALVCSEKDPSDPKICRHSIAFVHDIGASFGNRYKKVFLSDRPRGDLETYEKARVFKEGTCQFMYSSSRGDLPANISRTGQQAFLQRAAGLTPENLQRIFAASRIGYLGTNGSERDVSAREARWVKAIQDKLAEIRSAPCQ